MRCEIVLKGGSVPIWDGNPITPHSEIAGVDAPTLATEVVEVLLKALLMSPHKSLVVGCKELVFRLVFDEWARGTRASHFGSLTDQLLRIMSSREPLDLSCRFL